MYRVSGNIIDKANLFFQEKNKSATNGQIRGLQNGSINLNVKGPKE